MIDETMPFENEILYSMARGILRKMLRMQVISEDEYAIAHSVVARRFRPLSVRQ